MTNRNQRLQFRAGITGDLSDPSPTPLIIKNYKIRRITTPKPKDYSAIYELNMSLVDKIDLSREKDIS